jgi:ATP-dependent phosphofructokinase / diphosphate-dependent phosphofructokinase
MTTPSNSARKFRRVAILFAGGPAPAANAVISTCAALFVRNGIGVLGIKYGYSALIDYSPERPLEAGRDYIEIDNNVLRRTRNSQGILIGTARTNPGKDVSSPSHLDDPERSAPLRRVYEGLCALGVDALISIGGDDTL